MEFGFEPVCDQLRTRFEPASVMEFGFKKKDVVTKRLRTQRSVSESIGRRILQVVTLHQFDTCLI